MNDNPLGHAVVTLVSTPAGVELYTSAATIDDAIALATLGLDALLRQRAMAETRVRMRVDGVWVGGKG